MSDQDPAALQARIAELESQNTSLRSARAGKATGSGRARSIIAFVLILIAVILAPLAAVGTWVRTELVDTDAFVETLAPLADETAVQELVADQVIEAIDEGIEVDSLVGEVFDGLATLDLPPGALAALGALEAPATAGIHSLIDRSVDRVVASPQFAQVWDGILRETHSRTIAVMQGDSSATAQISDDGTVTLQVNAVVSQVKALLSAQGLEFAEQIPEVDREIPILTAESIVVVQFAYQLAVVVGYWMPWFVLALLGIGIAVARRRLRAVAWVGGGLAFAFVVLAVGLRVGRGLFVSSVSPSIMPPDTALVIFGQLTQELTATIAALTVLSTIIAVGAWFFGESAPAIAIRTAGDAAFGRLRPAMDRSGLNPGGFGRFVERWRTALLVALIAGTVFVVFWNRPLTGGAIASALGALLASILLIEALRRPEKALPPEESSSNEDPEHMATETEPLVENGSNAPSTR